MTEAELVAEAVSKMADLLTMMAAHFWWDRVFTYTGAVAGICLGYSLRRWKDG